MYHRRTFHRTFTEKVSHSQQNRAKQLCWEYNRTAPNEQEKRRSILQTLLGTCSPMTGIQPDFHCDYGFNIHTHGLAVINYNCVILDTSPVMPSTRSSAATALEPQHLLRWRKTSGSVQIPPSAAALPSGQVRLSGREASSPMTFPPVSSQQGCPAR